GDDVACLGCRPAAAFQVPDLRLGVGHGLAFPCGAERRAALCRVSFRVEPDAAMLTRSPFRGQPAPIAAAALGGYAGSSRNQGVATPAALLPAAIKPPGSPT